MPVGHENTQNIIRLLIRQQSQVSILAAVLKPIGFMVRWMLLQYAPISRRLMRTIGWRLEAMNANKSVEAGKMNPRLTSLLMIRLPDGMIGDWMCGSNISL
jgi:hypothetical protein